MKVTLAKASVLVKQLQELIKQHSLKLENVSSRSSTVEAALSDIISFQEEQSSVLETVSELTQTMYSLRHSVAEANTAEINTIMTDIVHYEQRAAIYVRADACGYLRDKTALANEIANDTDAYRGTVIPSFSLEMKESIRDDILKYRRLANHLKDELATLNHTTFISIEKNDETVLMEHGLV